MDLSKVKQQLTERKMALEDRASKTTRDASHRDDPLSADFAEQAVERENDDVLREIANEAQHEIDLINLALKRIDAGIYGDCSRCGEPIAEQRLIAVPYTTLCVNCAEDDS